MAKLAVVDRDEREGIRRALKHYKEEHVIGDPELRLRMIYLLGVDESAVPIRSLQRFVAGSHRTDDIMVRRYQRFLLAVAPPHGSVEIGKALVAHIVNPVYPAPREITEYQGRYESYSRPYTGEFFDTKFDKPTRAVFVFLPNPDPGFLTVHCFDRETHSPFISSRAFIRCGTYQFAIVSVGIGGSSFCVLAEIDDEPLTLQGLLIQSSGNWPPTEPAYEFRLVRTHGPKLTRGERSEPSANIDVTNV